MSNPIATLLTTVLSEAFARIPINPQDLVGLGVKNIEFYRNFIGRLIANANLTAPVQVALFQLLKAQKNLDRLGQGMAVRPTLSSVGTVQTAMNFISTATVGKVEDQTATRVCALKIPDSFPEVCAAIHILERPGAMEGDLADEVIAANWSSSLNYDSATQEVNRLAVKAKWDSWGTSAGKQTNKKGEKIAFDAGIYANQANDKIRLRDMTGAAFAATDNGITRTGMIAYIQHLRSRATPTVVSQAVETI